MSKPNLVYFDAYGRAEAIRIMFAYASVEYEDIRVGKDVWPYVKPNMPFLQIPIIEWNGLRLCQSFAIYKYLAIQFDLCGQTPQEDALVDMVGYAMNEMRHPFREMVVEEDVKFKAGMRKFYIEETLPTWLNYFEQTLESNGTGSGFFVGNKMTWADIVVSTFFEPGPYKTLVDVDLDLTHYPRIRRMISLVYSHPKIADWMQRRPVTVV